MNPSDFSPLIARGLPFLVFALYGCFGAFMALVASYLGFSVVLPEPFRELKGMALFAASCAFLCCGGIMALGVGSSLPWMDKPLMLILVGATWYAILGFRRAIYRLLRRFFGRALEIEEDEKCQEDEIEEDRGEGGKSVRSAAVGRETTSEKKRRN